MRKKLIFLSIAIWLTSLSLATIFLFKNGNATAQIIFCDVGQGDAALIIYGSSQILIDAGRNSSVLDCLEKYLPVWDRQIELAIATHADSDHIGGFETVLNRYFISEILISEYASTTDVFKRFRQAVLREINSGMKLNLAKVNSTQIVGQKILLYNLVSRVAGFENNPFLDTNPETLLWDKILEQNQAIKEQKLSLNALSIVTFVQIDKVKFLLTGDLDILREQALVERGLIVDIDVLKVGHHGSKTSTSDELLQASLPEMAIISVGNNNSYGLPSPQVVTKIEQFGSQVLRTDKMGDVVIETDGQRYWLKN